MKSEPKAFASLSSGLLARKGAARPAMRPQGFGQAGGNLEDLGWNDMGFEPPKPSSSPLRDIHAAEDAAAARVPFAGLTPVESPVHSQQAQLIDRLSGGSEALEEFDEVEEAEAFEAPTAFAAPDPVVEHPVTYEVEQTIAYVAPVSEPVTEEPIAFAPPAAEPVVVTQREVFKPARRAPKPRSAAGSNAKAAFTLRLDPGRHLKLRLACAVDGRSAQQLVTEALDQMLAAMPELDAMAERAKRKGS